MAWDNVRLPKCYGGLGIGKLKNLNMALLAKKIWHILNSIGEWRYIFVNKYIKRPSIQFLLNDEDIPNGYVIWNGILKARDLAKAKVIWKVGNGEEILF